MASTARATGYLELNIAGFDQAIKSAKNMLIGLGAAFTAIKIKDFFKDGINEAIQFGKEMAVAGDRLGRFDPGNLLIVQKAFQNAGMGAEEAQSKIGELLKSGRKIAEVFGGNANYGKALKQAANDYGQQAAILTRAAKLFQGLSNTIASIGEKMKTFFMSFTEPLVKPLQILLNLLNSTDLSGIGNKIGDGLAKGANIFIGLIANQELWSSLTDILKYGFYAAGDILMQSFEKVMTFFSTTFSEVTELWKKSFFSEDMQIVIISVFRGVSDLITGAFYKGAAKIIQALGFTETAAKIQKEGEFTSGMSEKYLSNAAQVAGEIDFGKGAGDFATAIGKGKEAASGVKFGESESGIKAKGIMDKLKVTIDSALTTADKLGKAAVEKVKPPTISYSEGGTGKIIADSLARVGGGGGFLRVGMSLAERTAVDTLKAARESNEIQKRIEENTSKGGKQVTMGR